MSGPVRIDRRGDVVVWTLDNPATRNAISDPETIAALEDAIAEADHDLGVRVAILTAAGPAFSSGGNIKDMRDRTGMFGGSPAELYRNYRHGIQRIPKALYYCEVPTIAAVNGPAVGAGCDVAMMCDIRIASTAATFAESFVRVGIVPGDGGAWLLSRAIGPARAAEMAYTGEPVDAATALEWGLISAVVEPALLLESAHTLATRIARQPPHALRMTKRLLRSAENHSLDGILDLSAAMQAAVHHTADHAEAVAAMLARREPRFTGT
ncbi:crotonase/enoyl-CoA hydratase family protein [Nocardia nova]|uniref:crotonase/enoyl-CoA hydratase family protein n=1 Tax=Nocardia nova TaxID=37330 RepID=UPI0037AA7FC7